MPGPDEKPLARREFFSVAFRKLLSPAAEYLDEKLSALIPPAALAETSGHFRLRPPGALPEKEFLETCERSGKCVAACPVQAIKIRAGEDAVDDAPYIIAEFQACVVCESIACTQACPSGALLPLKKVSQIRMGRAVMNFETCARTVGENCQICVEKCPVAEAIRIGEDGQVEVKISCVGCGVCEMHCPTYPKSIVVHPL